MDPFFTSAHSQTPKKINVRAKQSDVSNHQYTPPRTPGMKGIAQNIHQNTPPQTPTMNRIAHHNRITSSESQEPPHGNRSTNFDGSHQIEDSDPEESRDDETVNLAEQTPATRVHLSVSGSSSLQRKSRANAFSSSQAKTIGNQAFSKVNPHGGTSNAFRTRAIDGGSDIVNSEGRTGRQVIGTSDEEYEHSSTEDDQGPSQVIKRPHLSGADGGEEVILECQFKITVSFPCEKLR